MLILKIRLISFIFLTLILMLGASGIAFAHPPNDLDLSFNQETSVFTVVVRHNIGDPMPEAHYVKGVTVYLNGEEIIYQKMFSQSSSSEQEAWYYIIDADPGDTLEILAECSLFGTVREQLVVE